MMIPTLQFATAFFVAVATAIALAHALRLRLPIGRHAVRAVFHPGLTLGGLAEPAAVLLAFALLVATPAEGWVFALTAGALFVLVAMHAAYWLLPHPAARLSFAHGARQEPTRGALAPGLGETSEWPDGVDWRVLRDRWELSHVVRAILGLAGLLLVLAAIVL